MSLTSANRNNEVSETQKASAVMSAAIAALKTCKDELEKEMKALLLKEAKSESKEDTEKLTSLADFNAQVIGLDGFLKILKAGNLNDANDFLINNSLKKTKESGTEYLGSLFNVAVKDGNTNQLAHSLIAVLKHLDACKDSFKITAFLAISETARARMKILLEQLPKLEAGVKTYEKQFQITDSSSSSPNSNYRYGPQYSLANTRGQVLQQATAAHHNNNANVKGAIVPKK